MLAAKTIDPFQGLSEIRPSTLYEPDSLRYQMVYTQRNFYTNKSFAVYHENELQAVCLMSVSEKEGVQYLDAFGWPATSWHVPDLKVPRKLLSDCCRKEFQTIIRECAAHRIHFCKYDQEPIDGIYLELLDQGASINLSYHGMIDLTRTQEEIWQRFRKSLKNRVNQGKKELAVNTFTGKNCTWENILAFRELHIQEAGRETRSLDSWKVQFEQVGSGKAFLVLANRSDKLVGGALFIHDGHSCYYGVGAYNRSLFPMPISHVCVWHGILYAKEISCRFFDVGQIHFPYEQDLTEKERSIGDFKRGFGGDIITRMHFTL